MGDFQAEPTWERRDCFLRQATRAGLPGFAGLRQIIFGTAGPPERGSYPLACRSLQGKAGSQQNPSNSLFVVRLHGAPRYYLSLKREREAPMAGVSIRSARENIMRNLVLITGLALTLLTLHACALESTPDPGKAMNGVSADVTAEAPASSEEATADESLGTTTDAITPASCSVTLNFCDRPNSSIGTDCTETGCSLSTAISACKSLVTSHGCTQHCNAVMRDSSGAIIDTWRFSCGGTCCSESTQYCGPQGACCDGVHFNSACPPL